MRAIKQYPVNRRFLKILEDDHEWVVLTDTRLKPLVMVRGEKAKIPIEITGKAFNILKSTFPVGGIPVVYFLHTHKHSKAPSPGDMKAFIAEKYLNYFGVTLGGYGVITTTGITLIKLTSDKQNLNKLIGSLNEDYTLRANMRQKQIDGLRKISEDLSEREKERLWGRIKEHEFSRLTKEKPGIRKRIISRRLVGKRLRR